MNIAASLLASLSFAGAVLGITILGISTYHKRNMGEKLTDLIASYQLIPFSIARRLAPLLLLAEAAVFGFALVMLALGRLGLVSSFLAVTYLAYTLLLITTRLRGISLEDCGCHLSGEASTHSTASIATRNGIILCLLLPGVLLDTSVDSMSLLSVMISLVFSALLLIAFTGAERLIANSIKLNTLRNYHG